MHTAQIVCFVDVVWTDGKGRFCQLVHIDLGFGNGKRDADVDLQASGLFWPHLITTKFHGRILCHLVAGQ